MAREGIFIGYRTIGVAIVATMVALVASLVGAFGPDMQLGVEHRYYVCAGTLHINQYPDPEAAPVEDVTLSLRLYHFPITLWAGQRDGSDGGDATFTTGQGQSFYDRVVKLGDVIQISSAGTGNMLGMLNAISGSLQISDFGHHYDLRCRRTRL
jgi:hypothetical protein